MKGYFSRKFGRPLYRHTVCFPVNAPFFTSSRVVVGYRFRRKRFLGLQKRFFPLIWRSPKLFDDLVTLDPFDLNVMFFPPEPTHPNIGSGFGWVFRRFSNFQPANTMPTHFKSQRRSRPMAPLSLNPLMILLHKVD